MDWVRLDEFEFQTSQTSSQFFPIPSNPCVLWITEQALIWFNCFRRLPPTRDHIYHCLYHFVIRCMHGERETWNVHGTAGEASICAFRAGCNVRPGKNTHSAGSQERTRRDSKGRELHVSGNLKDVRTQYGTRLCSLLSAKTFYR
jgi:hypothetical protein